MLLFHRKMTDFDDDKSVKKIHLLLWQTFRRGAQNLFWQNLATILKALVVIHLVKGILVLLFWQVLHHIQAFLFRKK